MRHTLLFGLALTQNSCASKASTCGSSGADLTARMHSKLTSRPLVLWTPCPLNPPYNGVKTQVCHGMSHESVCRFHHVSYSTRMWSCAALMSAAYTTVALSREVGWQLLGVVLSAVQGGLGEASCLAMCTFFDSRAAITLWSSGTGFAGEALVQGWL